MKILIDTEGMRFWNKDADMSGWQTPDKMVKCIFMMGGKTPAALCTDDEFSEWHGL